MPRYALIDNYSGMVWCVVDASDPFEAANLTDDQHEAPPRKYLVGDLNTPLRKPIYGYRVHEVPAGFDVENAWAKEDEDLAYKLVVEHPYVAFISFEDLEE
jgi:hypothetical protein